MDANVLAAAQQIAARWSQRPEVQAVAVAGSQTSAYANPASDLDIYIYTTADLPAALRMEIAREFSPDAVLNDFWGAGVEWTASTGLHIDSMYFTCDWIEDQVRRCVERHEAWMGYTTAFWHTVLHSQPVFDRSGWFADLQTLARQPYPDALRHNIVRMNHLVLRTIPSSYRTQIEKAAARNDLVSLNHRVAALLASYFDIVFAVNRVTHPGEKRLLTVVEAQCESLPESLRADVERLLISAASGNAVLGAVEVLLGHLDAWLARHGLLA